MSVFAIVNPISGARPNRLAAARRTAMIEEEGARRRLRVDVRLTEGPGHATELASAAARAGEPLVVVWGGDGTINEAGAALAGTDTALGVVPAGSGNGFAAALGVPRDSRAALTLAIDGEATRIDVGTIAGRVFLNIAGVGLDAHIARLFNARGAGRRGGWPYVAISVREGCRYGAVDYDLQLDGIPRRVRALLVAFANGREYGNGARIAPAARLDDGLLDACVVEDRSVPARFWDARLLATGAADRAPGVHHQLIRQASIEQDGPVEFHVDGEPGVAHGPVEVRVVPAALKVKRGTLRQLR